MTTLLKCAECNDMFEVSDQIAEAMRRWRDQSGEPFTCSECAGVDEIISIETANSRLIRGVRGVMDLKDNR